MLLESLVSNCTCQTTAKRLIPRDAIIYTQANKQGHSCNCSCSNHDSSCSHFSASSLAGNNTNSQHIATTLSKTTTNSSTATTFAACCKDRICAVGHTTTNTHQHIPIHNFQTNTTAVGNTNAAATTSSGGRLISNSSTTTLYQNSDISPHSLSPALSSATTCGSNSNIFHYTATAASSSTASNLAESSSALLSSGGINKKKSSSSSNFMQRKKPILTRSEVSCSCSRRECEKQQISTNCVYFCFFATVSIFIFI